MQGGASLPWLTQPLAWAAVAEHAARSVPSPTQQAGPTHASPATPPHHCHTVQPPLPPLPPPQHAARHASELAAAPPTVMLVRPKHWTLLRFTGKASGLHGSQKPAPTLTPSMAAISASSRPG